MQHAEKRRDVVSNRTAVFTCAFFGLEKVFNFGQARCTRLSHRSVAQISRLSRCAQGFRVRDESAAVPASAEADEEGGERGPRVVDGFVILRVITLFELPPYLSSTLV